MPIPDIQTPIQRDNTATNFHWTKDGNQYLQGQMYLAAKRRMEQEQKEKEEAERKARQERFANMSDAERQSWVQDQWDKTEGLGEADSATDWYHAIEEDPYKEAEWDRNAAITSSIGSTIVGLPFSIGSIGLIPTLTTTATGYAGAYGGQKLGEAIDEKYGTNLAPWFSTIGGIIGGGAGYKGTTNLVSKMTKMPQNRTLFSQSFIDDAIDQKIKKLPYTTDQLDEMYNQYVKEGIIPENYGDYYARDYFGVKPTTQIDEGLRNKLRSYYWAKNNNVDMNLDPFKNRSPFVPSYSKEGRRYIAAQVKEIKDALAYAKQMKSKRGLTTEPQPDDLIKLYLSEDGVFDTYAMNNAINRGWDFMSEPILRFLPMAPEDASRNLTTITLGYPVKAKFGKSTFTPGAAATHEYFHGRKLFNTNRGAISGESPFYGMDYSKVPQRWKQLLRSNNADKHSYELAEGFSDMNATKYNMRGITDAATNPFIPYTYGDLIRYKLTPTGMRDRFIRQRGGWWKGWKQQKDALNTVYKNGGKL